MNTKNITSCIGHLSPSEILGVLGFPEKNKKGNAYYPSFRDKVVVDFGAGISDFANTILTTSSPKRVIAVDTIYTSEEEYADAIERSRLRVKESATKINNMRDGPEKNYNIGRCTGKAGKITRSKGTSSGI